MRNPRIGSDVEDFIIDQLKDPELAALHIKSAIEENDPTYLAETLERVVKAHGIGKIANASKLSRQALYKILGRDGNPSYSNICAILDSLGLTIKIEAKKKKRKSA